MRKYTHDIINLENLFPGPKTNKSKINDYIKTIEKPFDLSLLKKVFKKQIPFNTIQSHISGLCSNGALERIGKGVYQKTSIDVESIDFNQLKTAPVERWEDKNGPNKILITDLQYRKVSEYLHGDSLILCGPNAELRIRQSFCITGVNHKLYLIDNNQSIFKLILDRLPEKCRRHIKPILCNVGDINHDTVFQDLDFCNTWVYKDNSKREAGEILANRLIQQLHCNYPIAAMNFTFAMRPFNKRETVRAVNSILHVLGASIKSFDRCVDGWGDGAPVILNPKTGHGCIHNPDWINKGRIIELDFYSYSDSKTQMITCLIIYNGS